MLLFPVVLHGQSVLRIQPEAPVGGALLSILYRLPSHDSLSPSDSLVAEVLCMGPRPVVIDVLLHSGQRSLTGTFDVPSDARALFIRISSRDRIDDRDGHCWSFPIFTIAGIPVPGAYAQLASAARLGGHTGFPVPRDLTTALTLTEREQTFHPDAPYGWTERWHIYLAEDRRGSDERIRSELDSLLVLWSDRQTEVCELLPFLELTGQRDRAGALEQVWAERDPRGPVALRAAWRDASDEANPEDRLRKIEDMANHFALTPDDDVLQLLVYTAIAAEQWDKADEYIHRMPRKEPMLLIALVQRLLATRTTIDRAAVLAKESVNAARNYDPAMKPTLTSLRAYRQQRAREVPLALEAYGDALRATGHLAFATKIYAEALEAAHGMDSDLERKLRETRAQIAKQE